MIYLVALFMMGCWQRRIGPLNEDKANNASILVAILFSWFNIERHLKNIQHAVKIIGLLCSLIKR